MDTQLLTLSKIFTERLFRIPDYQRGYAWTEKQLKDFWTDVQQLEAGRNHYTGVLTLESVSESIFGQWDDDSWIVAAKSYQPYFVVICGVQEYVESMARTPRSSIRQGSFTPHILGCPQHRKSDAKYPFERKLRPKTPFLREYALFSSRSWARNMRSILPLKSFHFKLLVV